MKLTVLLVSFVSVLAYIGNVRADCCRNSLTMSYVVYDGICAIAGGSSGSKGCTITICADGKPRVGTFCGRGSCNIFGCNCDNNCITGKWKESFLEINKSHKIVVIQQYWS